MEEHSGSRKIRAQLLQQQMESMCGCREKKRACLGEALSEDVAVEIVGRELTSKRSSEIHLYLPERLRK